MQVKRDFDAVYASDPDPWAIGAADSERYNLYFTEIFPYVTAGSKILDIGCGQGTFLARFANTSAELHGVESADAAIERGKLSFPYVHFHCGTAESLQQCAQIDGMKFDIIIFSDAVFRLCNEQKLNSVRWIAEHLAQSGIAFITAYCPGGKLLHPQELEKFVGHNFSILESGVLPSGYVWFLCRRVRFLAAFAYDYGSGTTPQSFHAVDWQGQLLDPAVRCLDAARTMSIPVTFFVAMDEVFWLREHAPREADLVEVQIRRMVAEGHDVQLQLHPDSLFLERESSGKYLADCAGELTILIMQHKSALEGIARASKPEYCVTCFKTTMQAGILFKPLYDALAAVGITCDASMSPDEKFVVLGNDGAHCYSCQHPYMISAFSPELKAPPAEHAILEFPLTVIAGKKLHITEESLSETLKLIEGKISTRKLQSSSFLLERILWRAKLIFTNYYDKITQYVCSVDSFSGFLKSWNTLCGIIYKITPFISTFYARMLHALDARYPSCLLYQDMYFVCTVGSSIFLHKESFHDAITKIQSYGVEISRLSQLSQHALDTMPRYADSECDGITLQDEANIHVLADTHHRKQSDFLQSLLPPDRLHVLDFGCGSGYWAKALHDRHPHMRVHGVDGSARFIAAANERYACAGVTFSVAPFTDLPFLDDSFDAVYADNSLEHAYDVQATLAEVYRVLTDGGCLVAALPPDGYNPERCCASHTWKTTPSDVRKRLVAIGFVEVDIQEVDVRRVLGETSFPPSRDTMLYVVAWKRGHVS